MVDNNRAVKIDDVDVQILREVESNYNTSLSDISERIGLSKSAVHYRLNKLEEQNVIKEVSARINPEIFDLTNMMITEVMVRHEEDYSEDVGNQLSDIKGVTQVYYTMGDVDFIVISRTQNRDQMDRLINDIIGIDSVHKTSSTFVLQEFKTGDKIMSNMSDEMISNISTKPSEANDKEGNDD